MKPGTVLFLSAATGNGHDAAVKAITQAWDRCPEGGLTPVTFDPLTGGTAPRFLRRICRWYGPVTRRAPWLWGAVFHLTNLPLVSTVLSVIVTALAKPAIIGALRRHRPSLVVCVHPLVVGAAVAACTTMRPRPAVVTLVTDLVTGHRCWWSRHVDRTFVPSAELMRTAWRRRAVNVHPQPVGIPVAEQFHPRYAAGSRSRHRARLGLRPEGFVVLTVAGGEGTRGLRRWTEVLVHEVPDIEVVALCGQNEALRRDLAALAARSGGRLSVLGRVDDVAEWMRCADVVVTKAGPSIIAEATSLRIPLVLLSHLPGQEAGNAEKVAAAGAARIVHGGGALAREIRALHRDRTTRERMRAAAGRFGDPPAAARIAALLAEVAVNRRVTAGSAARHEYGGSASRTMRPPSEPDAPEGTAAAPRPGTRA